MIRAVISDFGGVLTTPLSGAFVAYSERSGISPVQVGAAMERVTRAHGRHPLFELEKGAISYRRFVEMLEAELGEGVDFQAFSQVLMDNLHRNETMIELVRDLRRRGLRTALLTNNVREWERLWRAKLPDIDELFEVIVDSAFVGMQAGARDLPPHARTPRRRARGTRVRLRRRPRGQLRGGGSARDARGALRRLGAGERGDRGRPARQEVSAPRLNRRRARRAARSGDTEPGAREARHLSPRRPGPARRASHLAASLFASGPCLREAVKHPPERRSIGTRRPLPLVARNGRGKICCVDEEPVRLDRWLWAARLVKTRGLAVAAVNGGRIHVNGQRVKPSKEIRAGDRIEATIGQARLELVVKGVSWRRGPAREATRLYEETAESRAARERHAAESRLARPLGAQGGARPTKRDRRRLEATPGARRGRR